MAQYFVYTDPVTGLRFRDGIRIVTVPDPEYVVDKELTIAGFDLDLGNGEGEGVGWENRGGIQ